MSDAEVSAALMAEGCERLRGFYEIGPVQRAAVESFADAVRQGVPEGFTPADARVLRKANHALALELHKWREAIINELVTAHIYTSEHDANPRKAVQDAITWNCQVALDPLVSSDAMALVRRGLEEAVQTCEEEGSRIDAGWKSCVDAIRGRIETMCADGLNGPAQANHYWVRRPHQRMDAIGLGRQKGADERGISFGMTGANMHFQIGVQRFLLAYEPTHQQEFEFMKNMLTHAISNIGVDPAAGPDSTVTTLVRNVPAPPSRLTDSEIGEIWFAAKIPGLTETSARILIRAAEERILSGARTAPRGGSGDRAWLADDEEFEGNPSFG